MNYSHRFSAVALIATLLLSVGCIREQEYIRKQEYIPIHKEILKSSAKLYLAPLGDFPRDVADQLASFYQRKYKIDVETLPSVALSKAAMNPKRRQLIAERAIEILKEANPHLNNSSEAIVIGLTNLDMYVAALDWKFSFSWRLQNKYAVVSSGRMHLPNGRQKVTGKVILSRLRKMVTKNVGVLYYKLGPSDNPRSVLYRNIGGLRELDNMGEDF